MNKFRMETIERILNQLKYEIGEGLTFGDIQERISFKFIVRIPYGEGVRFVEGGFRTRPMHLLEENKDCEEAADEIERLRQQNKQFWDAFQKAANEIIRLTENAKQDAQFLGAYHHICQKYGIAPSSSDLIEAMQEIAAAKATGGE